MTKKTRSDVCAAELKALLNARNQLIYVVTREETRVENYLYNAAEAARFVPRFWDVAQGVTDLNGNRQNIGGLGPDETLTAIAQRARETDEKKMERGVWIMRDLPVWLTGPAGAAPLRQLRNFARSVPASVNSAQAVIVISPNGDVPAELTDHATVIEWPMPDRDEIAAILDGLIEEYKLTDMLNNGNRDRAIDAAVGLSGEEAQACFSRSLVQSRTIDPAVVARDKKRVISRDGLLEWFDPLPDGLAAVGGLENLKSWLMSRSSAYTAEARAYGLPRPRGAMLVGISGCGKSLMCKAISTGWQCPLVRVDLGALKNMYVGKSEANLRKVFQIIEALGFCVVWFDEVEKSLQGATSGAADGGVSSDALGAVLTWMQERRSDAFVIMTANDIDALPPEFMRKGRFDELFWVDLPNETERRAVLAAALRANGRNHVELEIELAAVSEVCDGFNGAEIAAIVPDALFNAFADNVREITTDDLIAAAEMVVPLSVTMETKIKDMRKKAQGRFRPASVPEKATNVVDKNPRVRRLDIA